MKKHLKTIVIITGFLAGLLIAYCVKGEVLPLSANPIKLLWGTPKAELSAICIEGTKYLVAVKGDSVDVEPMLNPSGTPRACNLGGQNDPR